ncbi:MAG: hypothetical protein HY064_08445 [Bacteroidetes bacterium]|nr:hypothetical protein [Bacteroidota bacterium]
METEKIKSNKKHLNIGIITAMALIGYFLIMRVAGLARIPEFRLFNFIILFAGIFWSMKRETGGSDFSFFERLGKGCLTVITAVAIFSVFIVIYLNFDTGLMEQLKHATGASQYLAPETAGIAVFAEGISSGFVMAYIFLSYIGDKKVHKHDRKEIQFNK